jgi:hypothetical protein
MTKEERKEYMKKYRADNKDKKYFDNNKELIKKYKKDYYIKNKESIKIKQKLYYQTNKDNIANCVKNYYEKNKETINNKNKKYYKDYVKRRKLIDPLFKLKCRLISNISTHIKNGGYTKKSRTHEILGCSFIEFKEYLESKFEYWMTWENYGKYNGTLDYGWDIDHIIPASSAITEDEILKLNHYTNLQPLCSKINRDIKKHFY